MLKYSVALFYLHLLSHDIKELPQNRLAVEPWGGFWGEKIYEQPHGGQDGKSCMAGERKHAALSQVTEQGLLVFPAVFW